MGIPNSCQVRSVGDYTSLSLGSSHWLWPGRGRKQVSGGLISLLLGKSLFYRTKSPLPCHLGSFEPSGIQLVPLGVWQLFVMQNTSRLHEDLLRLLALFSMYIDVWFQLYIYFMFFSVLIFCVFSANITLLYKKKGHLFWFHPSLVNIGAAASTLKGSSLTHILAKKKMFLIAVLPGLCIYLIWGRKIAPE